MSKSFILGTAALGLTHIGLDLSEQVEAMYVTKPTTILVLIAWVAFRSAWCSYARLIFGGLVFSLFGDICLMLRNEQFILGLSSFLLAHLFYIAAFVKRGTQVRVPAVLGMLLIAGAYLSFLWPHLGALRIPVTVYCGVISTMGICALGMLGRHPSAPWILLASALFILSDASLALNRFYAPIPYSPILVMGTYFAAQALFAYSTVTGAGVLGRVAKTV